MRITQNILFAFVICSALLFAACTTTNQTNQSDNTSIPADGVRYISTDLEQCKVIRYACIRGTEPFTDDKGCGCRPVADTVDNTTPDENGRKYVSHDPAQCAATLFVCENGTQTFFDSTGCGCEQATDKPAMFTCTPQSRTAEVCPQIYRPVCGWFGEKIQCFAYPCAMTASNECEACKNPNVEYYTQGACPTPGSPASDTPASTSLNYDERIEQMQPTVVKTVKGNAGVETSIQCHPSRTAAQGETPKLVAGMQACTMDYTAVDDCDSYLHLNQSAATLDITTQFLACVDLKSQTTSPSERLAPIESDKMCTMQYQPVCAEFYDGTTHTFGNACSASNVIGVVGTTQGECSQPPAQKRVVHDCAQNYIDMQNDQAAACTKEYRPVCASGTDGTAQTYGNVCEACTTSGVRQYAEGACNVAGQAAS